MKMSIVLTVGLVIGPMIGMASMAQTLASDCQKKAVDAALQAGSKSFEHCGGPLSVVRTDDGSYVIKVACTPESGSTSPFFRVSFSDVNCSTAKASLMTDAQVAASDCQKKAVDAALQAGSDAFEHCGAAMSVVKTDSGLYVIKVACTPETGSVSPYFTVHFGGDDCSSPKVDLVRADSPLCDHSAQENPSGEISKKISPINSAVAPLLH
jgi:hypothetical protein